MNLLNISIIIFYCLSFLSQQLLLCLSFPGCYQLSGFFFFTASFKRTGGKNAVTNVVKHLSAVTLLQSESDRKGCHYQALCTCTLLFLCFVTQTATVHSLRKVNKK